MYVIDGSPEVAEGADLDVDISVANCEGITPCTPLTAVTVCTLFALAAEALRSAHLLRSL